MTLSAKVDEIHAKMEIIELMSKYERYYDTRELNNLVDLFVDDCLVVYDDLGRIEGKAAMAKHLDAYFAGKTIFQDYFHIIANPWIEVSDETATGKFHFIGLYELQEIGAAWLVGFYEIQFRRPESVWKIENLRFEIKYLAPHSEGWVKTPMALR